MRMERKSFNKYNDNYMMQDQYRWIKTELKQVWTAM